jgi:hypothetical protein
MSQNSVNIRMSSIIETISAFEENIEQNFSQNGLKIPIIY